MSDDAPTVRPETDAQPDAPAAAEEKRRAARRRFLGRSAAAGSGLAIVTLYHTRAFATNGEKKISSFAECSSMHGNVVKDNNGVKKYENSLHHGTWDRMMCKY